MTHGKVDLEAIYEVMGKDQKMIQKTEPFYFKLKGDKIIGEYRGKQYELNLGK